MPTVFVLGTLLIGIAVLLTAFIKARATIRDLRQQLELAAQRQQNDERELSQRSALDSLKDEFVSNVSHELRTPLTSIRGALGLLSSGVLGNVDAKAKNLLRIALTNTERLIRLINDVLDLERMDSGRAVLQVRRCSLPDLIHQATETMNAMADASEVKITIAATARAVLPSVFFDGDSDRILQVLTNLLSNAIKFSPAGSTVTIDIETPPDALIFRVADQGRGIPDDQLESIFERFKQVEHSDSQKRGGTGLGLAICRSIIQQHGGTIWAQHNPTKGVSICVRLPRLQRTYDATVPRQQRSENASNRGNSADKDSAGDAESDPGGGSPVLLCDENDEHRSLVAQQLRSRGHNVLEASSCEEAIKAAGERPAHSPLQGILLDLHMADAKGWEKLGVLKQNAQTTNVPIVVLSTQPAIDAKGKIVVSNVSGTPSEDRLLAGLERALKSERGPGRILLVEDDEDLASVVKSGFQDTNVHVDHAATLQRAMTLCREQRPDLLILDLTLPDGDGFSLVEWLRGRVELRSLPLIVYSGREVTEAERSKLRLGPTRFLTKAKVQARDVEQLVLAMVGSSRGGLVAGQSHDRETTTSGLTGR